MPHKAKLPPYTRTPSSVNRPKVVVLIAVIALAVVLNGPLPSAGAASSRTAGASDAEIPRARMTDEISILAEGRGNPWIKLSDGREVITPYSGPAELSELFELNQARPLSLCSADFDEDGVPDLIGGYAGPNGGIITLLRGNVDSIYPHAPEAKQRKAKGTFTDAPFLSPSFVFSVPEAADFVGAGDFDGDGHWDVVAARRGGSKLYLMSGDGRGGLKLASQLELHGRATVLCVGEINRKDGLDDVVVGINADSGARVLVYEGPEGALRSKPEIFDVSAEVTALAMGQLDDGYEMDLAIAAGRELMILHGRDRRLSLDEERQAEVAPTRLSTRAFPFTIKSMAVGDFTQLSQASITVLGEDGNLAVVRNENKTPSKNPELEQWKSDLITSNSWSESSRLICARVSSTPGDNLIVVDSANHRIQIITTEMMAEMMAQDGQRTAGVDLAVGIPPVSIEGEPLLVLPMRLDGDALDDLVLFTRERSALTTMVSVAATLTVTNTNDSGPGSLRQAILTANSLSGADNINFSIPGAGVPT
ncbi:MAG: VCBS repeat-containing protein, partial [Blastocatellia bacterium]